MLDSETIGGRIKALRKAKKLTQGELSQKLGVSRPTLTQIENGSIGLKLEILTSLVNILNTSYEYLIEGKASEPTENTNVTENENEDMPYSVDPLALEIIRDVIVELKENNAHLRKVNEFLMARVKDPETLAELADLTAAKKVG